MKKCKQGYYYCYKDKKCKRIPTGYRVGGGGWLRREKDNEKDEGNEDGDNKNGNGNGNGNSNGGSNGGGVSEGWSDKYKKSINCENPKGFSQRAHCQGKKKMNVNEEGLRDWFGKSKSKDGKKGWVNVVTGDSCASDKPGEGIPKCVSSAKRASMSKKERLAAAAAKRRKDPGQQQKTGAAKPTMVKTDRKTRKEEHESMTEAKIGFSNPAIKGRPVPYPKGHPEEGKPMEFNKAETEGKNRYDRYNRKHGTKIRADQPLPEEKIVEAKDKPGKGSGKKDACYHKVKSRYSVWPSAYASGALVKCRKKGAANWGNKSEEVNFRLKIDEKCWDGYTQKGLKKKGGKMVPNCVKEVMGIGEGYADDGDVIRPHYNIKMKDGKLRTLKDIDAKLKDKGTKKEEVETVDEGQKCWKGYEKKGTKKMFGKTYNNCVKKEEVDCSHTKKGKDCPVHGSDACPDKMSEAAETIHKAGQTYKVIFNWRSKIFNMTFFFAGSERPTMDEMKAAVEKVYPGALLYTFMPAMNDPTKPIIVTQKESMCGEPITIPSESEIKRKNYLLNIGVIGEGAAWTKKSGKNEKGGLNEKGRKSYERENPGSDLKAPSKKVGNPRRASFCARMKGMKKKLTSKKTASDPNSRINKSLRAWNC